MTEAERKLAVDTVAADPMAGDLIVGSGGCRKLRIAGRGFGKSGGYRIVAYFAGVDAPVFLLWLCRKEDLGSVERKKRQPDQRSSQRFGESNRNPCREPQGIGALITTGLPGPPRRGAITMDSKDFNGVLEGLNGAVAFARGDDAPGLRVHIPAEIDVKAIRDKLGMTQARFAERHGFSTAQVRDWEQGRRVPDPGVRALLKVIAAEPEMVERVLASTGRG